jgi:hypothetical protein
MRRSLSWLLVLVGLLASPAAGAAAYDEAVSGDISGNRLAPTAINLDPGTNSVSATSIAGDLEYFRVNVPAGFRLGNITLGSFSSGTNVAFAAIQAGTTFTVAPENAAAQIGQLLGYTHIGATMVGTDILDNLGQGAGAIGFSGPLPAGNYTFWSQETAGLPSSYTLVFSVTAAPAAPVPALGVGFALALAGGLGVIGARRLRHRRPR